MKVRPIQQKLKTTDFTARVAVIRGEAGGAQQVVATISTEDAFGIPSVLCHLKLSLVEARRVGTALIEASVAG
jgi:hypothetical protein